MSSVIPLRVWRPLHRRARALARRSAAAPVIEAVMRRRLSYLDRSALNELHEAVRKVESLDGVLIEAGCALGGSAIVMTAAKSPARPFLIYDLFGMPPAPTAGDGADVHARYAIVASGAAEGIGGDAYYGYRDDVLAEVRRNFAELGVDVEANNVQFIRGRLQETLRGDEPVALAHLDCDRYESVRVCLERIAPRLVRGGVLIIDDYEVWSGCRKAVDEYFAGRRNEFRFRWKARLHVERR